MTAIVSSCRRPARPSAPRAARRGSAACGTCCASPRHSPGARDSRSTGHRRCRRRPGGGPDLADVRGQQVARRALEVAAAGGHGLPDVGPPGAGKSMLAARLPGCCRRSRMPRSSRARYPLDCAAAAAVECWRARPFRAPHHSASAPPSSAAARGRHRARSPSRITACCSSTSCRSPAQRAGGAARAARDGPRLHRTRRLPRAVPARFQLVAAMNPCPALRRRQPGTLPLLAVGSAPLSRQVVGTADGSHRPSRHRSRRWTTSRYV